VKIISRRAADSRRNIFHNRAKTRQVVIIALMLFLAGGEARAARVQIVTGDVARFFKLYDAAQGTPSAQQLQGDYIDAGSPGVRQFIPHRIISAEKLAAEIEKHREVYDRAEKCARSLPNVKARLDRAFDKLARILPGAKFPPVTVLVGRNNSGGTTGQSGVLIGIEVVCRADWMQPDLEDRLVHLIAHEYGHVQQPGGDKDTDDHPTVLVAALREGGAELIADLISGQISNAHLIGWTKGREKDIETRFLKEADSRDLKPWLSQGPGTKGNPGDLA
jgi:hypothetical protein